MQYEVWREPGKTGKTYFVFDAKVKTADAIHETAKARKMAEKRLTAYVGFIRRGKDLFICDSVADIQPKTKKVVVVTGK